MSSVSLDDSVPLCWSADIVNQLAGCTKICKSLRVENNPPIDDVVNSGVVPRLVEFLSIDSSKNQQHKNSNQLLELQFQAAWALGNIASGTHDHTRVVVESGAIAKLTTLLLSSSQELSKQCVWALANIAGDTVACKDAILNCPSCVDHIIQLKNTYIKDLQAISARNNWDLHKFYLNCFNFVNNKLLTAKDINVNSFLVESADCLNYGNCNNHEEDLLNLRNITKSVRNIAWLILNLIRRRRLSQMPKTAANANYNNSKKQEQAQAHLLDPLFEALCDIMFNISDFDTLHYTCFGLQCVDANNALMLIMCQKFDLIAKLLECVRQDKDDRIRVFAMQALAHLSKQAALDQQPQVKLINIMLDAGVLAAIESVLNANEDRECVLFGCRVIRNICGFDWRFAKNVVYYSDTSSNASDTSDTSDTSDEAINEANEVSDDSDEKECKQRHGKMFAKLVHLLSVDVSVCSLETKKAIIQATSNITDIIHCVGKEYANKSLTWTQERLVWIGHLKNDDNGSCALSYSNKNKYKKNLFSKDLVYKILSYLNVKFDKSYCKKLEQERDIHVLQTVECVAESGVLKSLCRFANHGIWVGKPALKAISDILLCGEISRSRIQTQTGTKQAAKKADNRYCLMVKSYGLLVTIKKVKTRKETPDDLSAMIDTMLNDFFTTEL